MASEMGESAAGEGIPDEGWEVRQAARGANMLQSRSWCLFQAALGRPTRFAEDDDWSWIGSLMHGRGYSYLYVPYGPTVRDGGRYAQALASIREAGRALGADLVRCEPMGCDGDLDHLGLVRASSVQPPRSHVLDLSLDEGVLRGGMESGHRNAVNQASKRGVEITISGVLSLAPDAIGLLKAAASERGFRSHDRSYFATMLETLVPLGFARMGFARVGEELASASIVFDCYGTRAYAHAGNAELARKARSSVPLVWALAMDAKARGLTAFDFWGVAPEGAPRADPWFGFSAFKRGFGGTDVVYAGTWEMPLRPLKSRLISVGRRAAGVARRLRS